MLIPHNKVIVHVEDETAVARTVHSGFWTCGNTIESFENEIAAILNRKYAVCVSTGTAALKLSLLALGVTRGDHILIPAYSCVALANAVLSLGAVPIAVDVESGSWNISPLSVKKYMRISPKAVVAVNTFGVPARVQEIENLGVPVIEDCAHGFGMYGMGAQGSLSIASFYATKFLGAGEGGAIFLNDASKAEYLRDLRNYVDKAPSAVRSNYKMTDILASLALSRLQRLKQTITWRQELAKLYMENLSSLAERKILDLPPAQNRIWYRFTAYLKKGSAQDCARQLNDQGIGAALPVECWHGNYDGSYPNSASAFKKIVSLPLYEGLTPQEVQLVTSTLSNYLAGKA